MFVWAGSQIDAVLNAYVWTTLAQVFNWTALLAVALLTLYILLYGIAVVRGEVSEPLSEFVWKTVKLGLILAIATSATAYREHVSEMVDAMATSMAAAFRPTVPGAPEPSTVWRVLDDFNSQASELIVLAAKMDTNKYVPNLMAWFLAVVFTLANSALLVVAFAITIFANAMKSFSLAIGPIFILGLMWKPTAKFFDAWLGMLLSTVVLIWIAYFVLGFSIGISTLHIQRLAIGFPTLNHAAEAVAYFILLVTFAFILYQAPSLAASLTGGGPSQYGAGIVRDAYRAYKWATEKKQPDPQLGQASGGSARKGTGLPYAAGHAAGAGLRHAASGAQTLASGAGAAGRYAYQRAAAMGRRILNK